MSGGDLFVDQKNKPQWIGKVALAWAAKAFGEPEIDGNRIKIPDLAARNVPELEIALYTDWQSRDSELGLVLVDERKFELIKATSLLRNSLQKRVRLLSIARTRHQALAAINASEPNPALRYSDKIFAGIDAEIAKLTAELSHLQNFSTRIESFHTLLTRLIENTAVYPELEQSLRLLGQSWRGQQRVRLWGERVPVSARNNPALMVFQPEYMNFSGYMINLPGIDEGVILTKETACYLLSQLEVIALLASEVEEQAREQVDNSDNWYPQLTLIRAVVEFFYYCNFELPYAYVQTVMDSVIAGKVWTYRDQWVASQENIDSVQRMKRMGSEVASLLINQGRLLQCQVENQLNDLLSTDARPVAMEAGNTRLLYQPYWSVGLAQFEFDESGKRVRFHTSPAMIGSLITGLLETQTHLDRLASSRLGGPLETMLGLALLDERAFTANSLQLETRARYERLARFWQSIGRRRAIVMLGDDYVHAVSEALSVLGKPGPEHPTFLTVQFGVKPGSAPTTKPDAAFDPFASLVIADQVRLIELVNITWQLGEKFLKLLTNNVELTAIVSQLAELATNFENDLKLRLNENWLFSLDPVWALLRSSAPVLWDFWSKIKSGEDWLSPLLAVPAPDAIGLMLRLFGDDMRLIMLIEMSGVMMLSRLRSNSPFGTQALYWALSPYLANDPEHTSGVTQVADYYYDAEIRFDTAQAFASAFRQHLARLIDDLRGLGVAEEHFRLFAVVMEQLDRNYDFNSKK
jgi:hypothetical protein